MNIRLGHFTLLCLALGLVGCIDLVQGLNPAQQDEVDAGRTGGEDDTACGTPVDQPEGLSCCLYFGGSTTCRQGPCVEGTTSGSYVVELEDNTTVWSVTSICPDGVDSVSTHSCAPVEPTTPPDGITMPSRIFRYAPGGTWSPDDIDTGEDNSQEYAECCISWKGEKVSCTSGPCSTTWCLGPVCIVNAECYDTPDGVKCYKQ